MSLVPGMSYMTSSMRRSRRERRARAPVPFLRARMASSRRASGVKCRDAPSMAISFEYCLVREFFGSVRTVMSWSSVSSSSTLTIGRRPMNSGMKPKLRRSSGSTIPTIFRLFAARSKVFSPVALKPMTWRPRRRSMTFSKPTNAPPQMNRMLVVSTRMYSCCGCLRPPCGGTLQTVPSRIFSSACCTPSPETSRVIETLLVVRAILSISSMYTMPICARFTS